MTNYTNYKMIKSFTAHTNEIDDVEFAISELLEQLNIEGNILKNTIGIVTCYAEYIESGVIKALCEKLPFEIAGITTIASASSGNNGEMMLGLLVLTSDDVFFSMGLTEPITEENKEPLRAAYEEASGKLPEKPSLMFSFVPLLFHIGNDFYGDSMSEISDGIPNFGTLTVDHNEDYKDAQVIMNGNAWRDRYVFILVSGKIQPEFYVGTIAEEKIFSEKVVVTASKSSQLEKVNDVPIIDYLVSFGMPRNAQGTVDGIRSFPLIVDFNDGAMPVIRSMFAFTPEGNVVCGGNVPVGATLSIGELDDAEIKNTAIATVKKAIRENKGRTFLIFSCIGRFFAQGFNQMDEMNSVCSCLDEAGISYLFAYSGGELCPVPSGEGKLANRIHNSTFVICVL